MKKIIVVILAAILTFFLCACNSDGYDRAIVSLPNGEIIEGEVKSYSIGSNSVYVEFTDGTFYRTGSMNVALIKD